MEPAGVLHVEVPGRLLAQLLAALQDVSDVRMSIARDVARRG